MHTEVDVPNPSRVLLPGLYAEATITLEKKDNALAVPLAGGESEGDQIDGGCGGRRPTRSRSGRRDSGIQTATDAEVLSGLKEGESVVVSDRSGLKAGPRRCSPR